MPQLRVLPTELLIPDPDVQLDFTLETRRVANLVTNWNPDYAIVLVVVPLDDGRFGIIDGRHRFLAGKSRGVKEWRCDVHPDVQSVADKARLKLAIDQQRRRVRPIEHFLERVKMEEPVACEIKGIVESRGFEIGKLSAGKPFRRFEAVNALETMFNVIGPDGLRRSLSFNTRWREDRKANQGDWIKGIGLLVRDGYDDAMTPSAWRRLEDVAPAIVLRQAAGAIESQASGNSDSWGAMAYEVARTLRRKARLKARPAMHRKGGHRSRPL